MSGFDFVVSHVGTNSYTEAMDRAGVPKSAPKRKGTKVPEPIKGPWNTPTPCRCGHGKIVQAGPGKGGCDRGLWAECPIPRPKEER